MTAALVRLFALIAFVLMPFGMGPALAMPTQAAIASMAAHCGEHPTKPDGKATHGMDCAAACSMMIDEAATVEAPIALPPMPGTIAVSKVADGLRPEAATPPPRQA